MNRATKAVVFDIGNVLVGWDPRPAFAPDLDGPEAVEAFLTRIDFARLNLRADGGARFAALAAELDDPADADRLAAYPRRFADTLSPPIQASWALMERLRERGFAIHAITNWSAETWPIGVAALPRLGRAFGTTIVSGQVGMIKPDPAIFRLFCQRAGLAPADCLFIDDNPANVAAAKGIGMDGLPFTSAEALEAALIERRLL